MNDSDDLPRDEDGKLAAFAWPGGYPILYLDGDNEVLCADCANASENEDSFPRERPVGHFVHYEGPDEYCAQCNKAVPSAYGE
jgi:hypothetical protein